MLLMLTVVRCSSAKTGAAAGSPTGATVSTSVGAAGGTVTSSDGSLQVSIPAGALAQDVTITVTPVTPPGPGSLGTAYDLGPNGTMFAMPITLAFHYSGLNLGGQPASDLRVATYVSGAWQTLTGFAEDTTAMTVSGTTTHFTYYAPTLLATDANGGQVCACALTASSCAEYPYSTFSPGGDCTGMSTGYTGECCFPVGQPVCIAVQSGGGMCAAPPCSASPTCSDTGAAAAACASSGLYGDTLDTGPLACTDNSDGAGLTATCCFAQSAPSCFVVAGAACPPTGCADAGLTCEEEAAAGTSPCTPYTSSTEQPGSCMDINGGASATCCYAAGVLPGVGNPATAGPWPGTLGGSAIPDAGTGPTPGCHPEMALATCFSTQANVMCNALPGLTPDAGPMGCNCTAVDVGGEECGGCVFSFGCLNGAESCVANMAPYDSGAMNSGTCDVDSVCMNQATMLAGMTSQTGCGGLVSP
jgi:hypothetical protein